MKLDQTRVETEVMIKMAMNEKNKTLKETVNIFKEIWSIISNPGHD